METLDIPIEFASELVAEKIKNMKPHQIQNLAIQLIRATSANIQDFLKYVDNPDSFEIEGFKAGGTAYAPVNNLWSTTAEQYLRENDHIVQIEGKEYFNATIIDVDFLSNSYIQLKLQYPIDKNQVEQKFMSINSLRSTDLL
jgi:hypothetical protein